jgi:prophage regulatory protein
MTSESVPAVKRLIRLPEVRQTVALSRSEIYRLISLQRFPAPVRLGDRAVAWDFDAVQEWLRQKISESRWASASHSKT